jgi:hypothetical protein
MFLTDLDARVAVNHGRDWPAPASDESVRLTEEVAPTAHAAFSPDEPWDRCERQCERSPSHADWKE